MLDHRDKSIKFSLLSDADVLKLGEVQVSVSKYYGGEESKSSAANGLLDPHMGPPNKFGTCETCHGKFENCPGHFGYMKLALPVYNVGYLSHIVGILKCICKDCDLLYLADRPEKLIISVIPVPPIPIRPSVRIDGTATSNENDVTIKLGEIIRRNASVQQVLSEASFNKKDLGVWENLQFTVAQYINSDVRLPSSFTSMQIGNKPTTGLVQRMKGKQGRIRWNLSGKRVEYTGRTVISPDPNLKITEVAIPILMARILTYPERVSHHNIERLRHAVRNGTSKYPGAKHIRKPDGTMMSLSINARKRLADELKLGDIVERHLIDGDVVLFNRQPSLHRMSIMSHRARIMPWRTLRFNESVCNPYNADFDGDEMNMHVPQTEEARAEALMLMGVQNNLCTPKNGEILVASTQDFLTSSFLITRKDTFYDRALFSLMCCYMGDAMDTLDLPTPAIPIELWTGKQLFSVLLRPHAEMKVYLNLTLTEKSYTKPSGKRVKPYETMCPNDGYVYIHNSELISGQLGKATLGNGNKDGLYSVLLRDYNSHAAAACMNRLAKLSARWIGNHGFSIGIDDVQPGDNLNDNTLRIISEGNKKCDDFILDFNKGKLKLQPGCNAPQTLEAEISGVLNKIRDETGKVCMEKLHWRNSPLIMSQCGSKGSPINISQMIACVGQQSVGGQRAPNGFMDRSLPHFPRKSKTPAAKGFVANSFYSGLTATDFFFHTMGGREGLVDTAVKTAETGYLSRKLIKGLEDLSVYYDNTVRDSSACIVQFTYGGDGRDPSQMEGKAGFPLNFDRLLMKAKATCPAGQHKSISSSEIREAVDERFSMHDMTLEGGCSEDFRKKLKQFIEKYALTLEITKRALLPHVGKVNDEQSGIIENVAQSICGITTQQLQVFLNTCISRYHKKKIDAGTNIGAIGAQSIGEPGTQMTLKTFHFAGVASMSILFLSSFFCLIIVHNFVNACSVLLNSLTDVTLGVPRIKEILHAAKKINTPVITAKLRTNDNISFAKLVKGQMERTLLGQVAKSIKLVLGLRSASIVISLDKSTIQALQLSVDAYTVKESILNTPKIKLKESHITVLDARKLEINPPSDKNKLYFDLNWLRNRLPTVVVKGIGTIQRAVINKKKERDKFNLLVEGTGLQAVMGMEGINGHETTSNHILEVQGTLGIEAARRSIIKEIQYTMESHGMSIDIRHMMLLADVMTYKGEVLGITIFGIKKMKESVLMLASFEKTADHFFNASVNGRVDKIEGVSECIITGVPMQTGTGMIGVKQRVPQLQLCKGSDVILS
ncbi:hypothetical protein L1987_53974 [Smallanthus sonchifolius]|uniref:Uncharacterized protein n=1 Tax=Smallanthus sonchifolius TaxID=185202 RepID=A0ACB9E6X4_9ASTR|nr:hypothetical protein L1987_53974 [Smallanthus sonchifolius]